MGLTGGGQVTHTVTVAAAYRSAAAVRAQRRDILRRRAAAHGPPLATS
jgi:hypothetical protein